MRKKFIIQVGFLSSTTLNLIKIKIKISMLYFIGNRIGQNLQNMSKEC